MPSSPIRNSTQWFFRGAILGAIAMYYWDPIHGEQRRSRVASRCADLLQKLEGARERWTGPHESARTRAEVEAQYPH